jgi:hypothetical protein
MTHIGKIGPLSKQRRNQLGHRLEDGLHIPHLKGGQELAGLLYRVQHDMPYDDLLEPKKPETPAPATSTETDSPPPAEAPVVNPTNPPVHPEESSLIQPDPTKNDESLSEKIDSPVAA